jgi:hypothetical protein
MCCACAAVFFFSSFPFSQFLLPIQKHVGGGCEKGNEEKKKTAAHAQHITVERYGAERTYCVLSPSLVHTVPCAELKSECYVINYGSNFVTPIDPRKI